MSRAQLSQTDPDQLVELYRDAAIQHGEGTEVGNHIAANNSAELIALIYAEIRHRGSDVQMKLLPLLSDASPAVRLWSASHALEFSPSEGQAALMELSASNKLLGFSAEMTLKEWRAGRLRFPSTDVP